MADIPYRLDKKLIVIRSQFHGKNGVYDTDLILDTGATFTILDPSVIEEMGYSENDKSSPSTVKSPDGLLGMNFLEQFDYCILHSQGIIRI